MNYKILVNSFSVLFLVQAKGLKFLSIIIYYRCARYRLDCLNWWASTADVLISSTELINSLLVSGEMSSRLKKHIYYLFYSFNITSMNEKFTFRDATLLNNWHYWKFNSASSILRLCRVKLSVCMYIWVCILTAGWLGAYYVFLLTSLSLSHTLSFSLCAPFILYLSVSGRPEECLLQQGLHCCSPAAVLWKWKKKKKQRERGKVRD